MSPPYLSKIDKARFTKLVKEITNQSELWGPGDLNFLFTELIKQYIVVNGNRYNYYNDIVGALECAKLEIYRRRIAPYEDQKIKENGDVY